MNSKSEPLSEEEYALYANSGYKACPVCRSTEVYNSMSWWCSKCGSSWNEITGVIGYEDLVESSGMMTNDEFEKNNGEICPVCRSSAILDRNQSYDNWKCENCGSTWDIVYAPVSYNISTFTRKDIL